MSNEEFKKIFLENRMHIPLSSGIIETNVVKNDKELDYICYVEGPTDEDFYGNIRNTPLSDKKIKFIPGLTKKESLNGQDIGKEGVISRYYEVFSKSNFKDLLKKSIFIIDNDNYGLLSQKYDENYLDANVFNITNGYAFENYFFIGDNIKKIFAYFNLPNEELNKFNKYLEKFIKEVSYYVRLKSCTVISCKKCKYHTYLPSTSVKFNSGKKEGQKIEANDIFNFDFTGKYNYYFRRNLMEIQNKRIEYVIKDYNLIMDYFNNITINFENDVRFVRGHDLYNFLQKYLIQKFNINISPRITENSRYLELLKIINIDLKIVNGLGEYID